MPAIPLAAVRMFPLRSVSKLVSKLTRTPAAAAMEAAPPVTTATARVLRSSRQRCLLPQHREVFDLPLFVLGVKPRFFRLPLPPKVGVLGLLSLLCLLCLLLPVSLSLFLLFSLPCSPRARRAQFVLSGYFFVLASPSCASPRRPLVPPRSRALLLLSLCFFAPPGFSFSCCSPAGLVAPSRRSLVFVGVCRFSRAILFPFSCWCVSCVFNQARCLFLCAALCISPFAPLLFLSNFNLRCFCVLPPLHAACACCVLS